MKREACFMSHCFMVRESFAHLIMNPFIDSLLTLVLAGIAIISFVICGILVAIG